MSQLMQRFSPWVFVVAAACVCGEAYTAIAQDQPATGAVDPLVAVASEQPASEQPAEKAAEQVAAPVEHKFVELAVYPPQASLHSPADRQRVVAVATRDDGVTLDVTNEVAWELAQDGAAPIATCEAGALVPHANGIARLKASWRDLSAAADVQVAGFEQPRPVSFRHDVMPVFMRAGCNTGGCHGSSRGKDGFRLSLFGFDPAGDYFRLTRELSTRRLNVALPDESLMLEKATGAVPHTGGKRFEIDSKYYDTLRAWVEAGAPNDLAEAPTVTALSIYPPKAVLEGEGAAQQFIAVAAYSDGRNRDVTDLAVFLTNNDASCAIDPDGRAVAAARGEAFVTARFDTHTVGSPALVLPADAKFEPRDEQPANYIDELVDAKLRTLRITASPLCSDEEFLRRVTIDVTGSLPTPEEYQAFLADAEPGKRSRKVDELLERKEFAAIWAMKWAELMLVRTEPNRVEYKPMFLYWQWINQQLADGVPLDEMVRSLLSASGSTFADPEVTFYQVDPLPEKIAENVAQSFLGIRVQCAQCHNHPFDRWTMDDYYSFTAFFAQIGRKSGEDYRDTVVFNRGDGETAHPLDGRQMPPKFLGGEAPDVKGKDRRAALADWVVSPENPYFAVSVANRVWAHFLGVGIVEPVDDIRVSNPASNPELFDALGARLVEYKYDLRQLVRDVCNSNAYQRSSAPNESNAGDQRNFAKAQVRRIPAEALLDCICQATEAQEKLPGLPLGARAVEIADGRAGTYFLSTFGRATRATVCACEANAEPTLSQALHMLNGDTVHGKIAQGKFIERQLDEGKTPAEVIDAIHVRCLARHATADETAQLLAVCGENPRPVAELEDVFWAVLNSREFLFNH